MNKLIETRWLPYGYRLYFVECEHFILLPKQLLKRPRNVNWSEWRVLNQFIAHWYGSHRNIRVKNDVRWCNRLGRNRDFWNDFRTEISRGIPVPNLELTIFTVKCYKIKKGVEETRSPGSAVHWHQNNGRSADDWSSDSGDVAKSKTLQSNQRVRSLCSSHILGTHT